MCCPDGHPDGLGIPATGIGDGLEKTVLYGDGDDSQQQHPQQLSSPHAASALALALA